MLATLAFLTQSCDHKDLCYRNEHHTELEIKFDWSNAPDAQPRTMVVQLFRMDGSHYQRREFTSREGGKSASRAANTRYSSTTGRWNP